VYLTMQNKKVITDGLTGINNRRELDAYLERRLKQRTEWGMLLIDVDDFKKINDTIGHKIGDEALWHVADILRTEFSGDGCFVARYGGDEFVICGEWKNRAELEQCIASIQKRVDSFNMEKERNYKLSLSVGAALWSECADSEASIVELADRSMYKQKQIHKERRNAGSEQYSIYSG
jgi:diguanylate cyclase (GGDEF)-like protein